LRWVSPVTDSTLYDETCDASSRASRLGCRVQVVTEEGLYWLLRRRILREAIPL
jgi:hypothetical protein